MIFPKIVNIWKQEIISATEEGMASFTIRLLTIVSLPHTFSNLHVCEYSGE